MKPEKVRQMFGVSDAEFQHFVMNYTPGQEIPKTEIFRQWRRHIPDEKAIERYKQTRLGRKLRKPSFVNRHLAYEWQLTLTHRPTGFEFNVPAYDKFITKRARRLFANKVHEQYLVFFKKQIEKMMVQELGKIKNNGVAPPKHSGKSLRKLKSLKARSAQRLARRPSRRTMDERLDAAYYGCLKEMGVLNEN